MGTGSDHGIALRRFHEKAVADPRFKEIAGYYILECRFMLKDYDYKGKGGDVGEATPAQLMVELTAKILNM